jgi:hypothetical protein
MKKINKKINKKAFSKGEFMVMLAVVAILLAIGSKIALDGSKSYGSFKTVANSFANAVAKYKDKAIIQKEEYNLKEVKDNGYIEDLKNPMDKSESCDMYESYVSIKDNSNKAIKLVCGDYVVEAVQGKSYKVYEVSEWSETHENKYNDGDMLYNYKENGNLVLPEYVSIKTFYALYEEKTGYKITDLNSVKSSGKELVSKPVYREKKLVKEMQ